MLMTGLSAFSALCMTTEISDQRIRCSSGSPSSSRLARPALAWNRTSPPVITPGSRSSRVAAYASVDFPLPLSPARPRTSPRRSTRFASFTACVASSPIP